MYYKHQIKYTKLTTEGDWIGSVSGLDNIRLGIKMGPQLYIDDAYFNWWYLSSSGVY